MKKKALIIDDNANNLTLEKDLLEVDGFLVFVAENATLGIDPARSQKHDTIIMDMRLPDMRGSEASFVSKPINMRTFAKDIAKYVK
jgi:two-component system, cell cycle response regulator DivK